MTNEKLNVDRCWNPSAPDVDDLGCHRWRALPYIEMTEHGPVAWWVCERCPARALHDAETEDGFEPDPIVVYPPSCFAEPPCALERCFVHDGETCALGYMSREACPRGGSCGCPRKASGETVHHDGCAEFQASVETISRAGTTGPEPVCIVHPPTGSASPACLQCAVTEEERKAFDAAEHENGIPWDDDPPTLKRHTPVPTGACP